VLQFVLLGFVALAGLVAGDAWGGTAGIVSGATGLLLMSAGALLAGWALLHLGANLTPMPRPRSDAQLVASGAYALVRHPIYGGIIALGFGWGLFAASPLALILAGVLAGFFELKSRREEAWLVEHDGGYAAYMEQTRRFFPGLY
jgi:protein-S-isoprenylcysteine O-methyltransferase Ste14